MVAHTGVGSRDATMLGKYTCKVASIGFALPSFLHLRDWVPSIRRKGALSLNLPKEKDLAMIVDGIS